MSGMAPILAGRHPAGVYRWEAAYDVEDVRDTVTSADWQFRLLDGAGVESKAQFLTAVGRVLEFPETYGANFDALADLLDDLTGSTLVLWESWSPFARADPTSFDIALQIFRERCADPVGSPLAVLLRGEGPEVTGLGLLE